MIANVLVDGVHRLPIKIVSNRRSDIIEALSHALNQSPNEFYLTQNGKLIQCSSNTSSGNGSTDDDDDDDTSHIDWECLNGTICVHQRVLGGKGGFGSMLRAIGAQIEKTTNREACRDLSGRRLRDINEEKRLKEYLDKQKDRQDDEASKIRRKIERLRSKPKHEFSDTEYFETRSNLLDDVSDALEDGLKKAVAGKSSTSTVTSTATATTTSAISSGTESSRDQDSSNDGHTAEASATSTSLKRKKPTKMLKKMKTKKKKKNVKGALWLDEGLSSGSDSSDDDDDDDDDASNSNSNSSSTKTDKK